MELAAFSEVRRCLLSFPRRRESSLSRAFWTPAGVYPREGGGGSDDLGGFLRSRRISCSIKLAAPAASG